MAIFSSIGGSTIEVCNWCGEFVVYLCLRPRGVVNVCGVTDDLISGFLCAGA